MRKKFKSLSNAKKFGKNLTVKMSTACKMADGSKGHWFILTKGKKKKKK